MGKVNIECRDEVVRKTGVGKAVALEFLKTQQAYILAKRCGLFDVPAPLRADLVSGVLELEYIDGLRLFSSLAVQGDMKFPALCRRAGIVLALIHEQLRLPEEWRMPMDTKSPDENSYAVWLHGDYAACNIAYRSRDDKVFILDWYQAPVLKETCTVGSRGFDVVWFVASIFMARPSARPWRINPEGCATAFIAGYQSRARARLTTDEYIQSQHRFAGAVRRIPRLASVSGIRRVIFNIDALICFLRWLKFGRNLSQAQIEAATQ